ncbi:MAG: hypothetical protein R3E66_00185 [bacterium]
MTVHVDDDAELAAPTSEQLVHRRIMFSMLRPPAMIAARFGFPLKELTNFIRLSYFRELRESGATLAEAAELIEVSTRTMKRLNAELRSDFFLPEVEHTLARRIEFMVWAEAKTLARIGQLLPGVPREDLETAIEALKAEGRVSEEHDGRQVRFRASHLVSRLVDEGFARRIGALNSLMQNVAETVIARFIEPKDVSFARTLNFRIRPEDHDELRTAYDALLQTMLKLEARVEDQASSVPIRMSVLWSEVDED